MQETQFWSLIWEDSTCRRATKPVHRKYWVHMPQLLKPPHPRARALPVQWQARAPQLQRSPSSLQLEKSLSSNKDPVVVELLSHIQCFANPQTVAGQALYPWSFPGKTTGVGCHFLLQGILQTQGSYPCLLHWQADSLSSEPPRKP